MHAFLLNIIITILLIYRVVICRLMKFIQNDLYMCYEFKNVTVILNLTLGHVYGITLVYKPL